jgi:hypothetical protein
LLPKDALKDLLAQTSLERKEKVLLCLAVDPAKARAVREIQELATGAGLRRAKDWNISAILFSAPGLAVRTTSGWELTAAGSEFVAKLAGPLLNSPIPKVASSLRSHLVKVQDPNTQRFVEEAIVCFENRQYRAAVVLSWVGAVALLYNHVVKNHLAAFNAEAIVRTQNAKQAWRPGKTADDLARMKESEFLIILDAISVLGKSVRQQLEKGLDLRNGCGHPNSLSIAENTVASHIEILILNVFSQF